MKAIRIDDLEPQKNFLAVDLRDILDLVKDQASQLIWQATDVWATGERSQELEELAQKSALIDGVLLQALAKEVTQIIDGEFQGFLPSSKEPWIIVRAVDSSWYELHCVDCDVIKKAQIKFKDTSEIEST